MQKMGMELGFIKGTAKANNIQVNKLELKPKTIIKKKQTLGPSLVWFSGLSTGLQTKGPLVPFPVRAHA